MKYCPNCKKEKRISDFTIDRTKKDGLATNCTHCRMKNRPNSQVKAEKCSIQETENNNDLSKRLQEEWLRKNKPTKC